MHARPSGTRMYTRGHARAEVHTYARVTHTCACTSIWRHSRGGAGPGCARVVTDREAGRVCVRVYGSLLQREP